MADQVLRFRLDSNEKEFNKTFKDYMAWQKKSVAEIINSKLYFVALQAMRLTKTADKNSIRQALEGESKKYPGTPLGALIVNSNLKKKNKKGLYGKKMDAAVQKLIRGRQSRTQFLRSGWIESLRVLDFWNKKNVENLKLTKRYAPKRPPGIKQYGKPKGACIYAKPWLAKTWGQISNQVGQGKQASPTVGPLIYEGLKAGINAEIRSMRMYMDRKYGEQFARMKASGKV